MLLEQQLKELAVRMQGSFVNIAREYIQNLFLSFFYASENSETILFKGGTALRLLYRSPRFSEDLDFSTRLIKQNLIENLIQESMLKLDQEGLQVELEESTPTSGGFIAIIGSKIGAHKFNITLEISSRKKNIEGELILVDNPYIPTYTLMSLKKEQLIAEKVEALLNRKKPRDFFDLYFMLRANLLPNKTVLRKILPLVEKTSIDFKKELGQFLPESHKRIIKGFKSTLESEIRRFI